MAARPTVAWNNRALQTLLLFGLFVALGVLIRQVTWPMGYGDADKYLRMASDPSTFVGSPWGYRLAVPFTASALSTVAAIPVESAFELLQLGLFGLFLTVLYRWLSIGFASRPWHAGLATLLCALTYPGVYNLHNFVHVGLAEHLCVMLGCLAIHLNRFRMLCLVTAASCLVKESVGLLLVPTFFAAAFLFDGWRTALRRTAVLSAAFVAPFLVLRSGVLFGGQAGMDAYASFYTWSYVESCYQTWGGFSGALSRMVTYFVPVGLVAAVGFYVAPPRVKVLAIIPILATIQILLATDLMRMVGVGVPVIIALSVLAMSRLDQLQALLLVAILGTHFLLVNHGIGMGLGSELACVAVAGVFWFNRAAFIPAPGRAERPAAPAPPARREARPDAS